MESFLARWRRGRARRALAARLYGKVVEQARRVEFYRDLGVADTPDGRFDMIVLHAVLLMDRLKGDSGGEAPVLAQAVFDVMFQDMDRSLREMGVGDLSVGGRVKRMAEAFLGRAVAYGEALRLGRRQQLEDALRRNLFRSAPRGNGEVAAMADYMIERREALRNRTFEEVQTLNFDFGRPAARRVWTS